MSGQKFEVWDAHVHFFSFNFFKTLIRMKSKELSLSDEFARLRENFGIETPPVSPVQLARRWIEEMEKYGDFKNCPVCEHPRGHSFRINRYSCFPG
jgi:hypothetical protein